MPNAKQCPRCSELAPIDSPQCARCGHQYRTQFVPDNKTQAVYLPDDPTQLPAVYQPLQPAVYQQRPQSSELQSPPSAVAPPARKYPGFLLMFALMALISAGLAVFFVQTHKPPFLGEWIETFGDTEGQVITLQPDGSGQVESVLKPSELQAEVTNAGSGTLQQKKSFHWQRSGGDSITVDPPLHTSAGNHVSLMRWSVSADGLTLNFSGSAERQDDTVGIYHRRSYFAAAPTWLSSWEQSNPEPGH